MKFLVCVLLSILPFSVYAATNTISIASTVSIQQLKIEFGAGETNQFSKENLDRTIQDVRTKALEAMKSRDERDYKPAIETMEMFLFNVSLELTPTNKACLQEALQKMTLMAEGLENKLTQMSILTGNRQQSLKSDTSPGGKAYGIDLNEARNMVIAQLTRDLITQGEIKNRLTKLRESLGTQTERLKK